MIRNRPSSSPFSRTVAARLTAVALLILCSPFRIRRLDLFLYLQAPFDVDKNHSLITDRYNNRNHALSQPTGNESAILGKEQRRLPHPHAGARDAKGDWGFVADVRAVKRSIEERYRISQEGISSNQNDFVPGSYLYYRDEEQVNASCNLAPGEGLEESRGWKMLNARVQVGGPAPRPDNNVTLPYLVGQPDMPSPPPPQPTTRNPRVLCAIYTYHKRHDMISAVAETWGWKCDGFFAASTRTVVQTDKLGFGAINLPHFGKEDYYNMWQKTRSILAYMYDHYREDYDFFFLSGDDTYLIVENLKQVLQGMGDRAWDWPLYFGQFFKSLKGEVFCGGGSGYVLNRKALERLVEDSFPTCEAELKSYQEDVLVGHCLLEIGIQANHSVDATGAQRFHGNSPEEVSRMNPPQNKSGFWSVSYNYWASMYGYRKGPDLISSQSISFITPEPLWR